MRNILPHQSGLKEFTILRIEGLHYTLCLCKEWYVKFNTKIDHEIKMANKLKTKLSTRDRFNFELCRIK